jgi:HlyD family secretion protein
MRDHHLLPLMSPSIIIVVLGLSTAVFSACRSTEDTAVAASPEPEHRLDVPAIKVGLSDLESSLEISGSLMPQTRVGIAAKLPGTLATISVDLGDRVRTGQTVAALDRRELDAQVDAAAAAVNVTHAALESVEAALANALVEHERAQNLFEKGALPRQRLDATETAKRSAIAQRDLASANLAQAEAALRRAREVQRDATLTSPIDGVVVERNYDAGSLVSPTEKPVVVIADLRTLKLAAGVSELEAGRLHVGMRARVTVQARPGEVFAGRLAAIAPEVDARNRHFLIEVRTANPDRTLLSGMYGVATIPLRRATQVVAVPRDAIVSRDGKPTVLRIDNNIVRETPITEGLTDGIAVQVASGLQAGAVIVADARRELAAGAAVNPIFAK